MAYKRVSKPRQKGAAPTKEDQVSTYIPGEKVEELLHAYTFNTKGAVEKLRIDLDGMDSSEAATIEITLHKLRKNEKIIKEFKAIAGANNLGNLKIDAGDRLLIKLIPGSEAFSLKGAWVSYAYVR